MNFEVNLPLVFSILGVHLLAVMSPGPDFILVTKNSLTFSRKAGIYTALGIALGLIVHITYSLTGLGLLLKHNQNLFRIIQIVGGSYLAYIGLSSLYSLFKKMRENDKVKSLSSSIAYDYDSETEVKLKEFNHEHTISDISIKKAITMGWITNVFNPKAGLFFVSIFTQFFEDKETILTKIIVAFAITIVTFLYFSLVSIGITTQSVKEKYLQLEFIIEFIFSCIILILAASILIP